MKTVSHSGAVFLCSLEPEGIINDFFIYFLILM